MRALLLGASTVVAPACELYFFIEHYYIPGVKPRASNVFRYFEIRYTRSFVRNASLRNVINCASLSRKTILRLIIFLSFPFFFNLYFPQNDLAIEIIANIGVHFFRRYREILNSLKLFGRF